MAAATATVEQWLAWTGDLAAGPSSPTSETVAASTDEALLERTAVAAKPIVPPAILAIGAVVVIARGVEDDRERGPKGRAGPQRVDDVAHVADPLMAKRFSRAELQSFAGAAVDDLIGPDVRLLFVGINPGLWTAAVNAHFARRGNRFWPALFHAGILPRLVDASGGMSPADRDLVLAAGIGITNLVPQASARADELTRAQLRDGARRLTDIVASTRPRVVAMLGLTAYRQAFERHSIVQGRQAEGIAGAELWVLPNPSGLNAHETAASLAAAYREAAVAAGVFDGRFPRA